MRAIASVAESLFKDYQHILDVGDVFSRDSLNQFNDHTSFSESLIIKKSSKNLLIVIGESWTYPDSLTGVSAYDGTDDLSHRCKSSFWAHMGNVLDADILHSAKPGNSNVWNIKNLQRIKSQFHQYFLEYSTVYLVFQLTSPWRDLSADSVVTESISKTEDTKYVLNIPKWTKKLLPIQEYFVRYDNNYLKCIEEITKSLNLKTLVWKNFNFFQSTYKPKNIHLIETPWIQFSATLANIKLPPLPGAMEPWAFDNFKTFKNYDVSTNLLLEEIDKMDKIHAVYNNGSLQEWHNGNHPNETNHKKWAEYMLEDSNWIKEST
jgi:hypothetical protein